MKGFLVIGVEVFEFQAVVIQAVVVQIVQV